MARTTEVVNKYHVPSDFCDRPYAVYIGRGSKWGNPYRISETTTRSQAIEFYKQRLWLDITQDRVTLEELAELSGKYLVCFCHPQPCHGDVLAAAADWAREQVEARPSAQRPT